MKKTLQLLDSIYRIQGYEKVPYPNLIKYINIDTIKYEIFTNRRQLIYFYTLLNSHDKKLFCSSSHWNYNVSINNYCVKLIDKDMIYMFIHSFKDNNIIRSAYMYKNNQLNKIDYESIQQYNYHPLIQKLNTYK